MMAGPYFPYYFTKELGFSMSTVVIWSLMTNLGAFVFAKSIGHAVDRVTGVNWLLWLGCGLISLSPLPYAFFGRDFLFYFGPFEYFVNGVGWMLFNLSMMKLLYQVIPEGNATRFFSVYAASVGAACALGTSLGGLLADQLISWGGFRALWVIAAFARATMSIYGYTLLRPTTLR
jgi:MFS-type transporter involved in bile tolerance (Atg22 family)